MPTGTSFDHPKAVKITTFTEYHQHIKRFIDTATITKYQPIESLQEDVYA